jgi:hypothetical protein
VAAFFRAHSVVKEILRESSHILLPAMSETRFMGIYILMIRMYQVKDELHDIVVQTKFNSWIVEQNDERIREEACRVKDTILDALIWRKVQLFIKICEPISKFCRLFDSCLPGSMGYFYPIFSLMVANITNEIAKPAIQDLVTSTTFNKIKAAISKSWTRFHYDVYSAGFCLNPFLRKNVLAIRDGADGGEEEFQDIIQSTLSILKTMVRRFHPSKMEKREIILTSDSVELDKVMQGVKAELMLYLDGSGQFFDRVEIPEDIPSGVYWRMYAPRGFINLYASRITEGCPSTSGVERAHFKFSRTRTKTRSRLSYIRNAGLVYLDTVLSSKPPDPIGSIRKLHYFFTSFSSQTDEDEQYLTSFLERMSQEELLLASAQEDIQENNHDDIEENQENNHDDIEENNQGVHMQPIEASGSGRPRRSVAQINWMKMFHMSGIDAHEEEVSGSDYEG